MSFHDYFKTTLQNPKLAMFIIAIFFGGIGGGYGISKIDLSLPSKDIKEYADQESEVSPNNEPNKITPKVTYNGLSKEEVIKLIDDRMKRHVDRFH